VARATSGGVTNRPAGWHHDFVFTSEFADQLARLAPVAALRLILLEQGILFTLDTLLQAYRRGLGDVPDLLILGDEGMLVTAARIPDVPEGLVWFTFDPDPAGSRTVTLVGIARAPNPGNPESAPP
jgi:hypothetical protein